MASKFYLGLDLGQAQDYTAAVIVERMTPDDARYAVRHIERVKLGTPYHAIVARVKALLATPQLAGHTTLIVDRTGVGAGIVDMLRAADLIPICVMITAGNTATHEGGEWHVPKRDLVAALTVALQTGRLKIAESLPHAHLLVQEMLSFRMKIALQTGHDSYEAWREGDHDDLVLAAALALWYAPRGDAGIAALDDEGEAERTPLPGYAPRRPMMKTDPEILEWLNGGPAATPLGSPLDFGVAILDERP